MNKTLAYEIDRIKIVDPENTDDLRPVEGKEYVTLVTCTPYAVNSHHLLVRGVRIPYIREQHQEAVQNGGMAFSGIDRQAMFRGSAAAFSILAVAVLILFIRSKKKRDKEKYRRKDIINI